MRVFDILAVNVVPLVGLAGIAYVLWLCLRLVRAVERLVDRGSPNARTEDR